MKAHYNQCSAASQINQPEEFNKLSSDKQVTLVTWIRSHLSPRKTINNRHSSYTLKHNFEDDKVHGGFYVTNGMFKGAMRVCGYVPDFEHDTNWCYRISNKSRFAIEAVESW